MTTAVGPREHTVEARGLRFHYVEWGDPASPPMVLLHGMSAMCRIWDHFAPAFQDRYRILAPDQRGHGDTSWPDDGAYRTDDFVSDLEALVDAWGIHRFVLIGLSMGGMNAIAYAAKHPDRVSHLVAVDIRPAINREKLPNRQLEKSISDHGHPTYEDREAAFSARAATHPYTPERSTRHHIEHLTRQLDDGRWTFKHDPRIGYFWDPRNLWSELPKVATPVLIVRGGQSQVLPPEQAEQMRAAFPNAELATIEESGHTVPEDTPERFIEVVDAFLKRHPS